MPKNKELEQKAIKEFRRTNGDIIRLQYVLGHKNLRSTISFIERKNLLQKEV